MAFIGRLHPLLIHFPIALVIAAAVAEIAAMVTRDGGWRTLAVGNVRAVHRRSAAGVRIYRIGLFAAGMVVAATGHVGRLLVWGANFLRP
jgi:hypothetical protein